MAQYVIDSTGIRETVGITIRPADGAKPQEINDDGDTTWYHTDAVAVDDATGEIIADDLGIVTQAGYDHDGDWVVGWPDDGQEVEGLQGVADALDLGSVDDLDYTVDHPEIDEPSDPPTVAAVDRDNSTDWLVIEWVGGSDARERIVGRYADEDDARRVERAAARAKHRSGGDNACYGAYAVAAADYYDPEPTEPGPDGWVVVVAYPEPHYDDDVTYYATEAEAERAAETRCREDADRTVTVADAADYYDEDDYDDD